MSKFQNKISFAWPLSGTVWEGEPFYNWVFLSTHMVPVFISSSCRTFNKSLCFSHVALSHLLSSLLLAFYNFGIFSITLSFENINLFFSYSNTIMDIITVPKIKIRISFIWIWGILVHSIFIYYFTYLINLFLSRLAPSVEHNTGLQLTILDQELSGDQESDTKRTEPPRHP